MTSNRQLLLKNVPVPSPQLVMDRESFRSRFLDLLSIIAVRARRKLGYTARWEKELTAAILDELRAAIAAKGGLTLFAFLPVGYEVHSDQESPHEVFFLEYCRDRKMDCLNLRPAFRASLAQGIDVGKHFTDKLFGVVYASIFDVRRRPSRQ